MSAPLILVHVPAGDAHLRADTAEALGIRPGERIDNALWQLAAQQDHERNRADRRARTHAA